MPADDPPILSKRRQNNFEVMYLHVECTGKYTRYN